MSNLLEICWQHLMSWLKNKQSNLQSFKTSTVLNGDVCWLLFLSLSSGQLWQRNALKNIQPMLEKDQKRIRCQLQLMPVVQERGKNKVRRWFFLAMHHSMFLICTQGLLGTAQHFCRETWTRSMTGIVLSSTAPPLSPKNWSVFILAAPGLSSQCSSSLGWQSWRRQESWVLVWLDIEQWKCSGWGSPAHMQAVVALTGPGSFWEWDVQLPGFVSSTRSWHHLLPCPR